MSLDDSMHRQALDGLVCGRSRGRREASLVGVVSYAYFDESGGFDQSHLVLGGYLGPVEMWKRFSDDWQEVLDQSPALPPFHAVYFESGRHGFEVLSRTGKAKRLTQLVDVVKKYQPQAIVCIVNIPNFRARVPAPSSEARRRKHEAWRYPYVYAAAHLVGTMCSIHEEREKDFGTIEVIFDYHEQLRGGTSQIIEKGVRDWLEPQYKARLGEIHWPKPKDRQNYAPLQAADLLVWHQRRKLTHNDGKNRRAYRELIAKYQNINFIGSKADTLGEWIEGHASSERKARRSLGSSKRQEPRD